MENNSKDFIDNKYRRSLGVHLTSKEIFLKYIFPEIESKLWDYTWMDLYAGEGNLILPILSSISSNKRIQFFKEHIFLFDIQPEMVQKCIINAKKYNIPSDIAEKNIQLRNNLERFPKFLKDVKFPLFHITNPPYLYLGYIKKHKETQKYLDYFKGKNDGYQDLYQIAMINDLRNEIENLIYIIPSNFLFGASVSNKFRRDFLRNYKIEKMNIFETKIFDYTGTNICIGFFKRKQFPKSENLEFNGIKIKKRNKQIIKKYILKPEFKYRAG
ncbi:MAG: N-6 DNA methylase, partial [Candidatus Thorarchaeota archaeon]